MAPCRSRWPSYQQARRRSRCFIGAQKDSTTVRDIKLIMEGFGKNITLGDSQVCFNAICSETLDTTMRLWTITPKYFNTGKSTCTLKENSGIFYISPIIEPCETCPYTPSPTGPGKLGAISLYLPHADRYVDQSYGIYSTRAGCRDSTIAAYKGVFPPPQMPFESGCFSFNP